MSEHTQMYTKIMSEHSRVQLPRGGQPWEPLRTTDTPKIAKDR
jgi:hypothetical protein